MNNHAFVWFDNNHAFAWFDKLSTSMGIFEIVREEMISESLFSVSKLPTLVMLLVIVCHCVERMGWDIIYKFLFLM